MDNNKVSVPNMTGCDFFPGFYCGKCDAWFVEEVRLVTHDRENHEPQQLHDDNVITKDFHYMNHKVPGYRLDGGCFRCGEEGHFQRECPKTPASGANCIPIGTGTNIH